MQDGVRYIAGMQENWERDYYLECKQLPAGKYMAFIEIDWHEVIQNEDRKFNFTCYGAGNCMMECDDTIGRELFLRHAFISKLDKNQDTIVVQDMEEHGAPLIKRYTEFTHPEGYIYMIIDN